MIPVPKFKFEDGRWCIIATVVVYAVMIAIASQFGHSQVLLQALGVPALEFPFMDLRGVASWCDAWSMGHDPAVTPTWLHLPGQSAPHANFLMNYSPLVLGFSFLGLRESCVSPWAIVLILLYVASLLMLAGPLSWKWGMLWSLLICSPSSVLAVERGNLDALIFTLLVMALLARRYPWMEAFLILGASLIKFFPMVSLLALWNGNRRFARLASWTAASLFLVFLFVLHSRLSSIAGSLAAQFQSAFGYSVIGNLVPMVRDFHDARLELSFMMLRVGATVAFLTALLIGCTYFKKKKGCLVSERSKHAFYLAAPIMLGLFLQGPQMDYKWIFFLLMVPAVMELISSSEVLDVWTSKGWMYGIILYSYWTFFSDEGSLRNSLLKQLLMWGVMILSAFLAGRIWSNRES
jgi:hypothetical protein